MDRMLHLDCDCHSGQHTVRFCKFEGEPELYVNYFLRADKRLIPRIWAAIKYVFGYESQFGHFDESVFGPSKIQQLRNFLADEVSA